MPGLTSGRTLGGSSRKRARPESADVDEEIIDSARASSLLKHEPGKRVRVSEAGSHRPVAASCNGHAEPSPGGEGDDDDVDEEEDGDEDARMSQTDVEDSTPPATQYETVRDKGFGHLRHEQEDDFRATQRLMSRDTVGENHTADNGILESVTCINFMCHERLHCDLGPLINFIVGENGSGKSAILTAITLCLGAKASSTNRGGSLKAFIKEGKDQSILTVRIKNQGVDAYMHDVYGDSIIVERHFSRAGGSGFKVKSATGRLISTKKSEVGEVTEYYCLQIDNPLNVLSQDNARQFLNAASDSQKYKFFFEGVQLAQLNTDYRLVAELLDSIESKKHEQTEEVAFRKKVYQDAMRLVESIQQNRELRKKRRLYGQQLAWSQVKDEEDELKRRGREIEKCETRIERVRRAAVRVDKAYADENEKLERMQERLAEMIEMESELISKEEQVTAEWQAAKGAAEKVQHDVRDARSRITRAQQQRDECARKIKEEEERVASMTGDALVTRREKLSQETENLARLRQDIAEGRGQLRELEKEAEARRQEAGRMAESVHRKQGEIKAARDKMSQLQRDDGPQWAAYERNVPRLLDMINKDGRFQEKPVGPLGSLISVANPRWISILEKTFGGTLNAFVVTNKEDQQRLQDMMRRLAIHHCPILVSNRRRINTEPNEPNKEFVTILSILTFADDLVRSQLIINNSIEQIILIEDREEAQEVMFRRRPDKVKACLCFHDSKRGHGLRLTNRSGHQLGTSPITPANGLPRMQAEVQSQIAQQREMLTQLEAELDNIRAEEAQLRRKSNEAQNAIKDHKARQVKLVKDERLLQVVINNLESELDAMDGIDGRLQSLEAEKKQYDGDIETYGNQFGALDVEKKEKFDLVKKLQARRAEAKAERQDHDERRNKHQEKVNMQTDARRLTLVQKNEAHDAIRQAEQAKQTAENEVRQQEKKVEAFTAEAASMVPERVHVPEGETYATIEKKMEALKKQLDDSTKRIGKTDEEVNSEATEAKEAYKQASLALRGSLELSSRLKQSLEVRLEKWRTFQRYISSSARAGFMYLLSERGFRGRLMLDHVNKKLQVQVEPDASRKDAAGRNTKTLSGGEKSFSSICLLLAIWDSMGSPLRCLDEFDVFMDNVNRAISTNMLISAARRSVSRQYIMITPNAIEGRARLEQDVKIIRMTDPRQRTLDDFR